MKQDKKSITLVGIGVVALIAAIQFNFSRIAELQNSEGNDDLASLSNTSINRSTELGKAIESKKSNQKEYDILMADPAMSQKWDVNITQTKEAWIKHRAVGSRDVKVCVIDTGIDVNHPDIKDNLWVNKGEVGKDKRGRDKSTNGFDDDNNGFTDDVHGYNFVANNSDLSDHHGHGTHIAGAIGAVGGNGVGISGIAPQVSLIIAKYYDPESNANNNLLNTIRAIRYCIAQEATIINYSGGGLEPSDKEREAVAYARDKGILFVAAAGNERSNTDVKKYYPADYDLDNIISVTAFDREKTVLPSSNYGMNTVDIAAPGKNIYSTLPGSAYGFMTGTSQATAVVTGVATLLKARFPDFDANRIIRHITETGDWEPVKLNGKTKNQKRLNAYRALAILDTGINVAGSIPTNSASVDIKQFAAGTRDLSNDSASVTLAPGSLNSFSDDLRKLIEQKRIQSTP